MIRIGFICSILLCWQGPLFSQTAPVNLYNLNNGNFRTYHAFNDTIDTKHFQTEKLNAVVFYLTNEIRLKKKLTALEYSPLLEAMANLHSKDMVEKGFFAHTNPKIRKHREPVDRAKTVGISNPFPAENIIEAYILQYTSGNPVVPVSPGIFKKPGNAVHISPHTYLSLGEEMLRMWMNSPNHRKNILSKQALQLGCGCAFFVNKEFNSMPSIMATQNFQWYEPIRSLE